jgi:heme O synthase-like polyprenyltransferase
VGGKEFNTPMRIPDFVSLTKPDVSLLIGLTTAAGYCLGASAQERTLAGRRPDAHVVGTVLVASGTATMNQLMERNLDALMLRTAHRLCVPLLVRFQARRRHSSGGPQPRDR